jgi:hypothetical protein
MALAAEKALKEETADWLTLEYPPSFEVGKPLPVKLTLKGVPAGKKITGSLLGYKADGTYLGGNHWAGGQTPEEGPVTLTFTPRPQDGLAAVGFRFYVTPKGWPERTHLADSKRLIPLKGAEVARDVLDRVPKKPAGGPRRPTVPQGPTKTEKPEAWLELTYPEKLVPGRRIPVLIKLHGAQKGLQVRADLHWMKADGKFGGMAAWGGNGQPITDPDGTHTVYFRPKPVKDMSHYIITVFLTPDGQWQTRKALATSSAIPPDLKAEDAARPRPDTVTFKKSWVSINPSRRGETVHKPGQWTEGDDWIVPVEYYIDPSDDWGGTEMRLLVMGPWVDRPDGKYTTKRGHMNYRGLGGRIECKIGERTTHEFAMKIPKPHEGPGKVGDSLLLIIWLTGADMNRWPWEVRGGGPAFVRLGGFFELDSGAPGNLFTYDEPVEMHLALKPDALAGDKQPRTVRYQVWNCSGQSVANGEKTFTPEKAGQTVPIPLKIQERGIFVFKAEVEGWEALETTFGRIPDVMKITRGEPTRFGAGHGGGPVGAVSEDGVAHNEEVLRIARRLGLTSCRHWMAWRRVNPAPGEFRWLEEYDRGLDLGVKHGIRTWLLLDYPPAWAIADVPPTSKYFQPFPFHDEELRTLVTTLGKRFRGKIIGWEWLNEIIPGDLCADPVGDYARFVRVGSEAAKAADPDVITTLAGGLWPRNFRQALLARGVAEHIDVLPVHYCNAGMIEEAREDLARVGAERVRIWDNESALGRSTWKMPLLEAVRDTQQSNWVLENWTDELSVDIASITWFGGDGSPTGDWDYIWSDLTPRPVAATLAVFASKMHRATPLGRFLLGEAGVVHLFEKRDGTPLLVVSSYKEGGETVTLNTGEPDLTLTDYLGNERRVKPEGGKAALALKPLRYFVEGGDLDVLKSYVAAEPAVSLAAAKRTRVMRVPRLTAFQGRPSEVLVRVRNLYQRELSGRVSLVLPARWSVPEPVAFRVAPAKQQILRVPLTDAGAAPGEHRGDIVVNWDWDKLPPLHSPIVLSLVSPELLGNLLTNSGFEQVDAQGKPVAWTGPGKIVAHEGPDLGHGERVLELSKTGGQWHHENQTRPVVGGQTYLYTAWIKTHDLPAGSNVYLSGKEGVLTRMHDVHVFKTPRTQENWDIFVCRFNAAPEVTSGSFTPVANGNGWAHYDNIRLTLFEGTDFAAEAHKTPAPVRVDGSLDEWDRSCPIPLIGKSQLTTVEKTYDWSPSNLSGVAYLAWSEKGLHLAVEVRDDRHVAGTDAETVRKDSLLIGVHPDNRRPGRDDAAFLYYLSAANPGGSGKHTLMRPAEHSGGLKAGALTRDSSVYDLAVTAADGRAVYELFMPWAELGIARPSPGAKIGLSFQLNDCDGAEGVAAHMNWGGGLSPVWMPRDFGVLTFVE